MASICWVAQCRTVRGGNSLKGAEVTSNRIQSSTRTREWRNKLHGAQPHYVDFSRKLRFWRTFKSKDGSALRAGYSSRFGLCLACMRMACCVQFKGWALPSSTWPWIPNLAPPPPHPPPPSLPQQMRKLREKRRAGYKTPRVERRAERPRLQPRVIPGIRGVLKFVAGRVSSPLHCDRAVHVEKAETNCLRSVTCSIWMDLSCSLLKP